MQKLVRIACFALTLLAMVQAQRFRFGDPGKACLVETRR